MKIDAQTFDARVLDARPTWMAVARPIHSNVSQCGNNCGIAHPHASTFERHECRMQRVAHEALHRDVVESYVCGYPFTRRSRREVADCRTNFL